MQLQGLRTIAIGGVASAVLDLRQSPRALGTGSLGCNSDCSVFL